MSASEPDSPEKGPSEEAAGGERRSAPSFWEKLGRKASRGVSAARKLGGKLGS